MKTIEYKTKNQVKYYFGEIMEENHEEFLKLNSKLDEIERYLTLIR